MTLRNPMASNVRHVVLWCLVLLAGAISTAAYTAMVELPDGSTWVRIDNAEIITVPEADPPIDPPAEPPAADDYTIEWGEGKSLSGSLEYYTGYFAPREPFVPRGTAVAGDGRYPVSYSVPKNLKGGEKLRLEVFLHPDSASDGGTRYCEGFGPGVAPGVIQIRLCTNGWPGRVNYATDGIVPEDWHGYSGGHAGKATYANGHQAVQAIAEVIARHRDSIDITAGIALRGHSYGANGVIFAALMWPNPWAKSLVSTVYATLPHALFVKDFLPRSVETQLAWRGADASLADFRRAQASDVHFRLHGSTRDSLGRANPEFFRLCEQRKQSCMGTWHAGGHDLKEPGIALPSTLTVDENQAFRLDQPLPVFTGSTANHWGSGANPRGHYNLGWSWHSRNMRSSAQELRIPLRYRRMTGLSTDLRKPLADQPLSASSSLALRRPGAIAEDRKRKLVWFLDGTDQRGTATISADGLLEIGTITLKSSDDYTDLVVRPADETVTRGLVYTRQPRARTPVPGSVIEEAANWQHASDVGRINTGLAEADLVYDDLTGKPHVIHNCTTSSEHCVAHEGRVSPDGSRIVYSVGYGNALVEVRSQGVPLGIYDIPELTHAQLWVFDVASRTTAPIPHHPKGAIDRQPEWLNNKKIVFATNRAGLFPFKAQVSGHLAPGRCFNSPYCVSQEYGYSNAGKSMQLWTMNIDGTEPRNITPHEDMALAPAVMSNGDILYSCWNAHANRSYDQAASVGPATQKNKYWLCRTDGNGADATVVLNAHKSTTLKTTAYLSGTSNGELRSQLRAIRSVAEIFRQKLAVTNYYRNNHVGSMGIIFGMDYLNPHVEGCSTAACFPDGESKSTRPGSGRYVPSTLKPITPYGTDQDRQIRRDALDRALGKAGYPAPDVGDDSFLITHGRGSCYEGTLHSLANRAAMGGEPTCQKAIYRVKVPMVTDPFDTAQMELVAGSDEWHLFDARRVAPYRELHGIEMPAQPIPLNPTAGCYLQVVDARKAELHQPSPYDWQKTRYERCATQGCAVNTEDREFHAREIHAMTVYQVEKWTTTYRGADRERFRLTMNNLGHESIAILGSAPVLDDGSVKMQVPCETPLMVTGSDRDGLSIAHDDMLMSLRSGETRTCHGCHDGHSEERAAELVLSARERFVTTRAAELWPEIPRLQPAITFADVRPILERRCTGCHEDMNDDDGLLYSKLTQDFEQLDWAWASKVESVRPNDDQLPRPSHGKWIEKFARESLLYWKCIGARADGRTDAQYANDIDFGPAHVSGATREECLTLGRWIDTGIQSG